MDDWTVMLAGLALMWVAIITLVIQIIRDSPTRAKSRSSRDAGKRTF